jgi:hypothetical protein
VTANMDLLDRLSAAGQLDLRFIAQRKSGTVHVVVPRPPAWEADEASQWPPVGDEALDLALGLTPTLCGYRALRHAGGPAGGDDLVSSFADDKLCQRCCRLLGRHSARAFEHPVPRPA